MRSQHANDDVMKVILIPKGLRVCPLVRVFKVTIGETGASCYMGRLFQGHFMQNYYIDAKSPTAVFIPLKLVYACSLFFF